MTTIKCSEVQAGDTILIGGKYRRVLLVENKGEQVCICTPTMRHYRGRNEQVLRA
jgi:hypothetical protein